MAIFREGRVIGYFVFQTQAAEPAIGQIQMHLFAQPTLGTDAVAVTEDQHAHHQFRVNRRAAYGVVEVSQVSAQIAEI